MPMRAALGLAGGAGAIVAVLIGCLAGIGILYELRDLHWFAIGPRVPDALPLLQLAGFDGQPVVRVIAAWLPAGLIIGVALIRIRPPQRLLVGGLLAATLLLFASDASYALARNLRLDHVLLDRAPGLGAWIEPLLLAGACALPRSVRSLRQANVRRPLGRPSAASLGPARSS